MEETNLYNIFISHALKGEKMNNKKKELIDIAERIILKNRKEIENYHTFADLQGHTDRGIEGWFQFELIASVFENNIDVKHPSSGADLRFYGREDIELRATTSFHPCYILDGLLDHKNQPPVLFFSGYNDKLFKKINRPTFTDEKYIFSCFTNYLKGERKKKLDSKSLSLEYKIINLKKPCIIGILAKSDKPYYRRIKVQSPD